MARLYLIYKKRKTKCTFLKQKKKKKKKKMVRERESRAVFV